VDVLCVAYVPAVRPSVMSACANVRTRRRMLASSFAVLDHGTKVEPTSRGNVKVTLAQKPCVVLHVLKRLLASWRLGRSIVPKYAKCSLGLLVKNNRNDNDNYVFVYCMLHNCILKKNYVLRNLTAVEFQSFFHHE